MRNGVLKSSSYIEQRMDDFIIVANFVIGVQIDAPQQAYPPTPLLRLPVCLYVWCLYVCLLRVYWYRFYILFSIDFLLLYNPFQTKGYCVCVRDLVLKTEMLIAYFSEHSE